MEALVGILSYIYQENIDDEINLKFNSTLLATYNQVEGKTESVDVIQQRVRQILVLTINTIKKFNQNVVLQLGCCGAGSYQDWKYSKWLQDAAISNKVPDSCCKSIMHECGVRDHPSNIFLEVSILF